MNNEAKRTGHHWLDRITEDPQHSVWYAQRWRDMVAAGADINGEARLIDAMAPRNARIFDAGSGTGRVGGYLIDAGHSVVGVDIDQYLVNIAKEEHPKGEWFVGELASFDLPEVAETNFDIIVSCGNVMSLIRVEDRVQTLQRFLSYLAEDGRAVLGFAAGRGYEFEDFFADAVTAGFDIVAKYSTWDLRPFKDDGDFLVAVLQPRSAA